MDSCPTKRKRSENDDHHQRSVRALVRLKTLGRRGGRPGGGERERQDMQQQQHNNRINNNFLYLPSV